MMGFKVFQSVQATLEGIETALMIRKKQLSEYNVPAYTIYGVSRIIKGVPRPFIKFATQPTSPALSKCADYLPKILVQEEWLFCFRRK
jgi:hypothetical protein